MKKIAISIVALLTFQLGMAQLKTPNASPKSSINQTIGLTEVQITYARPSVKNRVIFGDLVPYGKIWRTGANAATVIEFSTPITFGNTEVKAGKYALYSVPDTNQWKVFLYADSELWGAPGKNFDQGKVIAESVVKPLTINPKVETFTIGFDEIRNNDAMLTLAWDNILVKVPIKVNTRQAVIESIGKTMNGPTASDYHRAAMFYFEENIDLDKALEWSSKAVELNPTAYWVQKLKSDIQAAKKDYKNAIKTAEIALERAQKAGNDGYVKAIQENINAWKKK
ncbi:MULTISPECIES: DUF2911 domain-containing protein [Capnocytophaga]|uniref:DUF2911 domain-containing protein n=1 Tax=Capnocytophaga canis TaxID=1848903 RepID=A0A0B7IHD7_9FLAO|nr:MULTISPECIES: DUF2911 domain-containing protein [Capnocytophaga]ATA74107.1 DUF2911 domain-containing protein [Capnocytophaga sp. H2931]RIY37334.1 DUF2911 domain-containing protein [Capnocytophaga canis]CEN49383.1 conserved exported hypothetical protein [Capnocytophaga canis]